MLIHTQMKLLRESLNSSSSVWTLCSSFGCQIFCCPPRQNYGGSMSSWSLSCFRTPIFARTEFQAGCKGGPARFSLNPDTKSYLHFTPSVCRRVSHRSLHVCLACWAFFWSAGSRNQFVSTSRKFGFIAMAADQVLSIFQRCVVRQRSLEFMTPEGLC